MLGPAEWSVRVSDFNQWVDVQWGTDSLARARDFIASGTGIEAVIVDGSAAFVTSELVRALADAGIAGYALSHADEASAWIDGVTGITRICDLAELAPTNEAPDSVAVRAVKPDSRHAAVHRPPRDGCLVVAVWGPTGAPGVTSVAIGLAALAAREGLTVYLCDADSRGASIAIGLGLIDEVPGFAAACRLAGRGELTPTEFDRLSMKPDGYGGRLSVLTGIPRAARWAEIAGVKSRVVVEHLRQLSDVVIVDVGFGIEENEWVDGAPQRDGAARALVRDADVVVAVGLSDAVGIARLIRGLDELKELCATPLVVLNQTTRQSAKEATDAISRFTDHRVVSAVSRDSRDGLDEAATRSSSSVRSVWAAVNEAAEARVGRPER